MTVPPVCQVVCGAVRERGVDPVGGAGSDV